MDEGLGWALVVPVKRLAVAKTRLGPPYDVIRRDLALAFALDTTAAALASTLVTAVVVVTDEPEAAHSLGELGADVVGDEPDAGLNPAVAHGVHVAAHRYPSRAAGALSGDLPALRPDELDSALRRAESHAAAFLRDAHGTGTTLVVARRPADLRPGFGTDSARRHAAAGLAEITGDDMPSVRQDVDTADDLATALRLGVGSHTADVLARLG
ncbi:MAG: 2-phospho-L-lactate guanylyltransferase [Actinomycetes bacterium]